MKVIGTTSTGWNREYICMVTHAEIEKFLGLYYNAMKKTQELIQANQPVVTAILNGMNIQKIMNEQAAQPTVG